MKKFTLFLLLGVFLWQSFAQVPQKFSYQAAIRNSEGIAIANKDVDIKISLRKLTTDGEIVYSENHLITTSPLGIVSLSVGAGNLLAGDFLQIPWNNEIFIQVDFRLADEKGEYVTLGISQILSVPYSLYAGNAIQGEGVEGFITAFDGANWVSTNQINLSDNSVEIKAMDDRNQEEPIFKVLNSNNEIVFAVYEQGVRIYVDGDPDDKAKGNRSGFAIGGLTGFKADEDEKDYFSVSRERTRVLFDDEGKGNRSGFAIGGLTGFKADEDEKDYFSVSRGYTQVLFDDEAKGNRSGFAIGGLTGFKAEEDEKDYFSVSRERTRVLFDDEGKGNRSGFAIGGLTGLKANDDEKDYFNVSRKRTRVLFDDESKGNRSGFAIGGLTGFKSDPTDLLTVNFDTTTIYTTLQATGNVDILGNIYTGGTISTQVTYNGYTYQTIKIGGQTWFKENLQTLTYQDGNPINPLNEVFDYELEPTNRPVHGLLYAQSVVMSPMGLCPIGWHVPSMTDWDELFSWLGGTNWMDNYDLVAIRLMEVGSWDEAPGDLTPNNISGFSARPDGRGVLDIPDPTFSDIDQKAYFWTSGDGIGTFAYAYEISKTSGESIIPISNVSGDELFYVRCIKDNY